MSDTDPGMELFVFDRIFSRRHWPGLSLTCAIMVALAVLFVSNRDWRGVVVFGLFAIFVGLDVRQYRLDFAGCRVLRAVHVRGIVWVRFRQTGFLAWSQLSHVTVPDSPHSRGPSRFITQRLAEDAERSAR